MADNSFTGYVTDVVTRSTHQKLVNTAKIETGIKFACFTSSPFAKAVGLEALGAENMQNPEKFGKATPKNGMIRYDKGHSHISGSVFETMGNSYFTGRMGTFTPQLVEGGDEWAYSWLRMHTARYLPDVDIQDNGNGLIDVMTKNLLEMKQVYMRDFVYCLLGNSSQPSSGPATRYHDLTNLIPVTLTRTVGNISGSSTDSDGAYYWRSGIKEIANLGGGGEMDRPITLRRSMMDARNDQAKVAEVHDMNQYMFLASQGAYQYYDRLVYADKIQGGAVPVSTSYDALGIEHYMFGNCPMFWDPSVTIPWGATASTESIYGIHKPSYFISLRSEENFKLQIEQPRVHDTYQTVNMLLRTRFTPGVTARRPHFVCYDLPANPD